jgi:hypothetical protein
MQDARGRLDHRTERLTERLIEFNTAEERTAYLASLADAGCQGIYCPGCFCEFFPEQLEAHLERPRCGCPEHASQSQYRASPENHPPDRGSPGEAGLFRLPDDNGRHGNQSLNG